MKVKIGTNSWVETDLVSNIEVTGHSESFGGVYEPIYYNYWLLITIYTAAIKSKIQVDYYKNDDENEIIRKVNKILEPFEVKIKEMPW